MVEARAMAFAMEIGCPPFIHEGDSVTVIKTLNSEEESLFPFGHILTAAKKMTESISFSFSHVRKVGNFVAYNLAKHARYVSDYLVWMEDVHHIFILFC